MARGRENEEEIADPFFSYRNKLDEKNWEKIKPHLAKVFSDEQIPKVLENHLKEITAIQIAAQQSVITIGRFKQLSSNFYDEHEDLYDNPKFERAVRVVKEKYPVAV